MNTITAQNGERLDLVRGLGLWSATAVIVGSMIGQAVFLVASDMARELGSATKVLAVGGDYRRRAFAFCSLPCAIS